MNERKFLPRDDMLALLYAMVVFGRPSACLCVCTQTDVLSKWVNKHSKVRVTGSGDPFLPRLYTSVEYAMALCPSVCPSDVLSRQLNVSSRKWHRMVA